MAYGRYSEMWPHPHFFYFWGCQHSRAYKAMFSLVAPRNRPHMPCLWGLYVGTLILAEGGNLARRHLVHSVYGLGLGNV